MYQYTLETGSKKHLCPRCGRKTFVRVIDSVTGEYLPGTAGRCDRESNCGYQYTWKEYFGDNPEASSSTGQDARTKRTYHNRGRQEQALAAGSPSKVTRRSRIGFLKADHLEPTHLLETIGNYGSNTLVQFLMRLFQSDRKAVAEAVREYKIGTYDGWTSFPVIDRQGRICKAKLMKFDPVTGKRLKNRNGGGLIHSLQAKLKESKKLKADFETDKDVFFGEHLLAQFPRRTIAIVESEKTAVIASICKGVLPNMVWLATGSMGWLKVERIRRLGRDRTIVLYPDTDAGGKCIAKSHAIASDARRFDLTVKVSDLIERRSTAAEKEKGFDLADYLIREQQKRNDPTTLTHFRDIIEERLAVMMFDEGDVSTHDLSCLVEGANCPECTDGDLRHYASGILGCEFCGYSIKTESVKSAAG